jgi:hypothetical protein
MFITLLLVTFVISVSVSALAAGIFNKPMDGILRRIIADAISSAWLKYLKFAIYVVGISTGVRIGELERYITPHEFKNAQVIQLTVERWVLEVYRTIIESLQGIAWLLMVFFVLALLAFVVVRIFELRKGRVDATTQHQATTPNP